MKIRTHKEDNACCIVGVRNTLWVFPSKRGECWEGNRENLKKGDGYYENSDTRGGERNIGVRFVHCTLKSYILM